MTLKARLVAASRFFAPWVNALLLIVAGGLALWLVLSLITERHERRRAEAAVCVAELKAWRARDAFVARLVVHADPCVTLQTVAR